MCCMPSTCKISGLVPANQYLRFICLRLLGSKFGVEAFCYCVLRFSAFWLAGPKSRFRGRVELALEVSRRGSVELLNRVFIRLPSVKVVACFISFKRWPV